MNEDERQQFTKVVADCTPTMLGLAYVITGSQPAAERTLRRALSKTARRWGRLGDVPPESHIVELMCRHEVRWWRQLRRHRARIEPDTERPLGLRAAMRQALIALPPMERVVMALRYHERLTDEETAEVLGQSVKQVTRHTDRAVVRLRELLAELSTPDQSTLQLPRARTATLAVLAGSEPVAQLPRARTATDGPPDGGEPAGSEPETVGRHRA
jgi:DNA-directed RNA polymerase specialized sigma24 family protein